jgi:hypothetical protein
MTLGDARERLSMSFGERDRGVQLATDHVYLQVDRARKDLFSQWRCLAFKAATLDRSVTPPSAQREPGSSFAG